MRGTHLDAEVAQELVGLVRVEVGAGRERDAELLLELAEHVEPLPRRREVELELGALLALRVVLDLVAAREVLDEAADERLGEVHEVVHVCERGCRRASVAATRKRREGSEREGGLTGVGHVELADRELGVVREVDALVAEDAADLVHAVEAADDELLEVELGRDAHEEVEVERVVVRDEGLGRRAAGDLVHHGRLDLEEAEVVEELAHVVDDARALDEDVAALGVHDEVEVALAVALLLVLEAKVLLGELVQVGRQEDARRRRDRELVALGADRVARDAEDVAAAEQAVDRLELLGRLGLAAGGGKRGQSLSDEATRRSTRRTRTYLALAMTWILTPSLHRS